MKRILFFMIAGSLLLLTACGSSDDGGGAATKAVLKLRSSGTGTTIYGIDVTVRLPAGVTLKSSGSGTTDTGVVVPSGVAATNSVALAVYTAATGTFPANVRVLLANADGFTTGEFCTVNADIAAGHSPAATDFSIVSFLASDGSGSAISGLMGGFTATMQ